ncbi:MAG: hypothetical protein ACYDCL_03250 [Myxococcales bacterium]
MSLRFGRWLATLSVALLTTCGGGSNATYYKIAYTSLTTPTCVPSPNPITTFQGVDGAGTVAIYATPGNDSYLLDMGSSGYTGTLTSGTYVFEGIETVADKTNNTTVTTTADTKISLTPQGSGVTGSILVSNTCTSTGQTGCSYNGGTDSSGYTCSQSGTIVGTAVPSPTQAAVQAPTPVNGNPNLGN